MITYSGIKRCIPPEANALKQGECVMTLENGTEIVGAKAYRVEETKKD